MTLFVLVMFPILLLLGNWQLNRAEEKQRVFQEAEAARDLPLLSSAQYKNLSASQRRYRGLSLVGQFDPERYLLLDNQIHNGQVGYWLLQYFQTVDELAFVVNRGFVAGTAQRTQWPAIETPTGQRELTGVLWPQLGLLPLLGDDDGAEIAPGASDGWPKRIQRIDFTAFQRWLPGIEPIELRLQAGSNGSFPGFAPTRLPNGAPRHQGYAVQWFGLATVLMIGFVVFGRANGRDSA